MAGSGGAREGSGPKPFWQSKSGGKVTTHLRRIPACLTQDDIQEALTNLENQGRNINPVQWPGQKSK